MADPLGPGGWAYWRHRFVTWKSEAENLRAENKRLRDALITAAHWMPENPIGQPAKDDLAQVRQALGWVPLGGD